MKMIPLVTPIVYDDVVSRVTLLVKGECLNIVTSPNILNVFYCCNLSEMFYSFVKMLLLYLVIIES